MMKGGRYFHREPFSVKLWNKWLDEFNARQACTDGRIETMRDLIEAFHPTQED